MKAINNNYTRLMVSFFLIALLGSCNVTKHLQEDEQLYTGAELQIKKDSSSTALPQSVKNKITGNFTPKPNQKILGMYPALWFYLTTKEPKKDKGFRYFKKYQLGEEPVLMEDVDLSFNRELVKNTAENEGFFNAEADWDTIVNNKKTKVIYSLTPNKRWHLRNISYENDSTVIWQEIDSTLDESLLHPEDPFRLQTLKDERNRIDDYLKENGFYYFHPDNLLIQADTTVGDHLVDLRVKLKEDTPPDATEQYTINKVIVYPDYSFSGVENQRNPIPANTDSIELFNDIYLIDPQNKFKADLFDQALQFRSGDLYNRAAHDLTLKRLINLGVFKFVKNQFYRSDSTSNQFDAYYLLTPQQFQSLQAELKASTNSANYAGSELNVNWRHRNSLKGAELLKIEAYGALNVQVGGVGDKDARNLYRVGGKAGMSIPRLLTSFNIDESAEFIPNTNFQLGYEFQERTGLYSLHNANANAGYLWKQDARSEHELSLLDVTLVSPQYVTDEYRDEIDGNPYLQRVVDEQLIFGPSYRYRYSNSMLPKKHTFYNEASVKLSGTVYGLLTGADIDSGNQEEILGVAFSQFIKAKNDFRYYLQLGEESSLAARLEGGIAYPYGNSEFVPFSQQFFAGGSSSNRGFRARTIGPGSFDPRPFETSFIFDQAGDITLQTNIEYRPNIYQFLEGAIFVDAGNVWLVNENEEFPNGHFTGEFLNELAVSAGLGLRLDFDVLLVRADLATPVRKPYLPDGERWTFDQIDFGDKDWRSDNLILNLAIGYPF